MKKSLYLSLFFLLTLSLFATQLTEKNLHPSEPFKIYEIDKFIDTINYQGGAFSHDEQQILFASDASGIFNLYTISPQDEKVIQLTHSETHSFYPISYFPSDNRILFMSDEEGNEMTQIYLREESGEIKNLTPEGETKNTFYQWSHDFKSFLYGSNARDKRYVDLYEMDSTTLKPTMIFQNDEGYFFDTQSADNRYLVFSKNINSNTCDLYLLDRESNALKSLTGSQEGVKSFSPSFTLDNQYLYYLTDEGSDYPYLKRYELDTGNSEVIEKKAVNFCTFSQQCHYRITSSSKNGTNHIEIFDNFLQKPLDLPKFPEGEISSAKISTSESQMLFYVNSDTHPNNLYLYDFKTQHYQKLTESLNREINQEHLVKSEAIFFPSYDGMMIPALYYQPKNIPTNKKIPALILVHGGPGGQSKAEYNYLIQYLVNHGYAILAVNNRGSSGYGKTFFQAADKKHGEADLGDIIESKKYLIETGYVDENRIGIIGSSYGGYMTLAALAYHPDEMAVGIDIFGVSNWLRTLKNIPAWWENEREALYKKIGNPYLEEDYLISISPLFHAHKIKKPLMVLQGATDPRVLQAESDEIIEAIKDNGIPYEYLLFEDEGHGFTKKKNKLIASESILKFLKENL